MLDNCFYAGLCVFILGLILGSFYNVVIIRTLKNESIIYPPSKCPKCENKLLWWHKIPVLSYLLLKGRCYFCGEEISPQYPIVELISGFLFLLCWLKFGFSIKMVLSIICLSLFLVLAGMDLKEEVVSFKMTIALIIFSVLYNYDKILYSVFGALVAFIIAYAVRKILGRIFNKEAVGDGDIYMLTALGGFATCKHLVAGFVLMIIFQFLFCCPHFFKKIVDQKQYKIIFSGLWFLTCYLLLLLSKFYIIQLSTFWVILIFVNLFVTLIPVVKYLINEVRENKNSNIEPVSPSVFLSVLCVLFMI